jgi:outer membrane protein assembly factor BamB
VGLLLGVPGAAASVRPYDQAVAEGNDAGHTRFASGGSLDRPPLETRWTRNLGTEVSYPVAAAGRVFVVAHDSAHASATLHALDSATGATLWSRPVGRWATLAYDAGRVFSLDGEGVASAFSATDGATLWVRPIREPFDSTSPVAADGRLYAYLAWSGGALYSLNAADGTIAWTNSALYDGGTPALDGRHAYVHDGYDCSTAAVERSSGQTAWHRGFDCWALRYWVTADGGHVATGSSQLFDSATGSLRDQVFGGPPALAGTTNVALNGSTLQARNLRTGTTLWEFTGDGALATAPLVVNHVAYVGSGSGALFAVDLHTGAPVWSATIPGGTPGQAGMASAQGLLLVPTGGSLVALGDQTALPTAGLDLRISSGPDGPVTSTDATFSFGASGAGFSYSCRLDRGAWQACTSPVSYSGLAGGPHVFEVKTTGASGDVALAARSWSIAPGTPSTRITSGPPALTKERNATFRLATEHAARTECRLDGGAWGACSDPVSYWSLYDGPHVFEARSIDAFGRVEASPASWSWTIDATAPNATITSGPSGTVTSTSASFSFSSSESPSTFECRLDAGSWAGCSSPKSYSGLSTGTHTFAVRATDAAGNVDGTPATREWTVSAPTQTDGGTETPSDGGGTTPTQPPPEPTTTDGGSTSGTTGGGATVASSTAALRTTLVRGLRLVDTQTLAAQRTFLVNFEAPARGTLTIELRLRGGRDSGTLLARGARRMRAGQSAFVRVRTTRAGRALLRRMRRARVSVVVRFTPAGSAGERSSGAVTLRAARR